MLPIMEYFIKKHQCSFNLLVWCKTNPTPATNGSWLPDLEYCLVFKGKGTPKYNDGYEFKSKFFVSGINKADKDLYNHPTIKMLKQVKQHLQHSCKPGDIVFDCFCGSGTTLVAAKELGLNYLGFDNNEKYVKITKDRLNGCDQRGNMNLFETDFDKVQKEHYEQMNLFEGETE